MYINVLTKHEREYNIVMKNNKTKLLTIRLTEAELIRAKKKGRGNVSYWIRTLINK